MKIEFLLTLLIYHLLEWTNGRTAFSNLATIPGRWKILTLHHHDQLLDLCPGIFLVIIVIITFFVMVRWKIQVMDIRDTAQKLELFVLKTKFAITRLIWTVIPFPLPTAACCVIVPSTMVIVSFLDKSVHIYSSLTETKSQLMPVWVCFSQM